MTISFRISPSYYKRVTILVDILFPLYTLTKDIQLPHIGK